MSRLLLACLCGGALSWGQSPLRPPQDTAFEEAFGPTVQAAAQAFSEDRPIPHLPPPDAQTWKRFAGQMVDYDVLAAQMSFIQAGREPEQSLEAFEAMIRHVARKSHVEEDGAVRLYGSRVRGAGANAAAPAAVQAGLIAEMLNEHKLSPEMQKQLSQKLETTRQALLRNLRDDGSGASAAALEKSWVSRRDQGTLSLDSLLPRVQPVPFRVSDVPGAAPEAVLKSGAIYALMDWDRAREMAREVWRRARGFVGACYHAVKRALDSVLPEGWRSEVGQASAYQFASSINRNPKLFDKLKLRKIDPASLPDGIPPVGAIIVYNPGVCGFDADHGHIEIVVATDPPRACSDGCMGITPARLSCIRQNSPRDRVNVYVPVRSPVP